MELNARNSVTISYTKAVSYMYVAIIIIKQLSFNDTKIKTHIAFYHWNSAAQSVFFYIWFMTAVTLIVLRILVPEELLFDNALVW